MDLAFEFPKNWQWNFGDGLTIIAIMDLAFEYLHSFLTPLHMVLTIIAIMDLAFEYGKFFRFWSEKT